MNFYIAMALIIVGFGFLGGRLFDSRNEKVGDGATLGALVGAAATMLLLIGLRNYGEFIPQEAKTYEIVSVKNGMVNGVSKDKEVEQVELEDVKNYSNEDTTLVVQKGYYQWGFTKLHGETRYITE